jgi:hypothetical protein
MVVDGEVFKAARRVVDRHGARAIDYARARIEELAAEGDEIGAEAWRQIAEAVAEVQRNKRRPDEYIN